MKSTLTLLFICLLFNNLFTQEVSFSEEDLKPSDTIRINWSGKKILIMSDSILSEKKEKKTRTTWTSFNLGINGFLNADRSTDLSNDASLAQTNPKKVTQFMELDYRKSWNFSANLLTRFEIKNHHLGLVTGLGFDWNNYELKHNVRLDANGGQYVFDNVNEFNKAYTWGVVDTTISYSKNRFKTWFINVPLLLEVNIGKNKDKAFHIAAGTIFGLNLQTKVKYKYQLEGENKKVKDKQSFNTNPFRVSLTARIGYGGIAIFGTYSITPLFEDGRGPALHPFSVGISLPM